MLALYGERVTACEWPVDLSCLPDLPAVSDPPTPEETAALAAAQAARDNAVEMAEHVLWALSGRQFGTVEVTARPCPVYAQHYGYLPYIPIIDIGYDTVRAVDCGCGGHSCGCGGHPCTVTGPRVVHLPGPVDSIVEVSIEGVALNPDGYRLEGDALYRTGGELWPQQNLQRPLGEVNTWSVTFLQGVCPPAGVGVLTGTLAREFLAACDNNTECRLPRTVTSSSRRGVSYEFDPSKLLAAGKTGLPEIDMWLQTVNPNGLMAAPEVL